MSEVDFKPTGVCGQVLYEEHEDFERVRPQGPGASAVYDFCDGAGGCAHTSTTAHHVCCSSGSLSGPQSKLNSLALLHFGA